MDQYFSQVNSIKISPSDQTIIYNNCKDVVRRGIGYPVKRELLEPFLSEFYKLYPENLFHKVFGIYLTDPDATKTDPFWTIHQDMRPCALNIPIHNCGEGADTVIFDDTKLQSKATYNNEIKRMNFLLTGEKIVLTKYTQDMYTTYLLNAHQPHCASNLSRPNRMILSLGPNMPYKEALATFK
jgi:hypothetical protein